MIRVGASLSLTGRFAQFGRQAVAGLETWRSLDGSAELVIEDDRSERKTLERVLPEVAARCDLLLGPYSSILMRTAAELAADRGWLVWNHGGSGSDAAPGNVVSLLTPADRYALPFLRHIAQEAPGRLAITCGPGGFGRRVADGAEAIAAELGIETSRLAGDEVLTMDAGYGALFSAGVFEDDAGLVSRVLRLSDRPGRICSVAAGVKAFADAVSDPDGVYGVAQWAPGSGDAAAEGAFTRAYREHTGDAPDYPAVQAAAGAAVAIECARQSGGTNRDDLWSAAAALEISTMFGAFRIDPVSGIQLGHQMALVRWEGQSPVPLS